MTAILLPVFVTAIVLFIASSIAWTVSPHHRQDWVGHPTEKEFLEQLAASEVPRGQYIFPFITPTEMKDPERMATYEKGPHGTLNVWGSKPSMPRNLALTFLTFLVACFFIGYLTYSAVGTGETADFSKVFQIAGTAGLCTWCFSFIPNGIWFGKTLRSTVMDIADGFVYGILTGLSFGIMWP